MNANQGTPLSSEAPFPLVIGSRGSPLALYQAEAVRDALIKTAGLAPEAIAIEAIRTSGDRIQDRALSEAGGKGLFTKEIDEAQLAGRVHLATHSAKDLPTVLPHGLVIAGYLAREDARDAFLSLTAPDLASLPAGAVVGTASLRRQAIIARARPDLKLTLLRGNVGTRLAKLGEGSVDATILAVAGLKRLGLMQHATAVLPAEQFLPAVGQGAIAMVARADDEPSLALAARIGDTATGIAVSAERAFLHVLDGSCRTPIAAHATLAGDRLSLRVLVLRPDGREAYEDQREAGTDEAEQLGRAMGLAIKARLPAGFFQA
jgi:hydroxymethylbilane synthase